MTPFTRENVRLWLEELRFGALIGLGLWALAEVIGALAAWAGVWA
ncbi:hypothetical protein [Qipengyuania pacifica]|nr:hypothetical protein [Qipengyuania pacifica]